MFISSSKSKKRNLKSALCNYSTYFKIALPLEKIATPNIIFWYKDFFKFGFNDSKPLYTPSILVSLSLLYLLLKLCFPECRVYDLHLQSKFIKI